MVYVIYVSLHLQSENPNALYGTTCILLGTIAQYVYKFMINGASASNTPSYLFRLQVSIIWNCAILYLETIKHYFES